MLPIISPRAASPDNLSRISIRVLASAAAVFFGMQSAMALQYHPGVGAILVCNFDTGFHAPEMVKKRPVVVLSPDIAQRRGLCTVVPISTQEPTKKMPYHVLLEELQLPGHWCGGPNWVKADMINSVAFRRLELFRAGDRDQRNKRIYMEVRLTPADVKRVQQAVLHGLGMLSREFRP